MGLGLVWIRQASERNSSDCLEMAASSEPSRPIPPCTVWCGFERRFEITLRACWQLVDEYSFGY